MIPGRAAIAVAVAVAVDVSSGCSAFRLDSVPAEVQEAFRNGGGPGGCAAVVERAERVATAVDVDGATLQLWLAPTDGGGHATALVFTGPDEEAFGMASSCDQGLPGDGGAEGRLVEMGSGGMSSGPGGRERWWSSGRAPGDAETVEADFGDETVVADVGADGYFVVVHSEPGGDNTTSAASPRLTALDADGNPL